MRSNRHVLSLFLVPFLIFAFGFTFVSGSSLCKQHRRWLEEEVGYIISERERDRFRKLEAEEAHEEFIRQFWRLRDPDPSTEINEFEQQHYRRIREANQKFHEGTPGWKTDRGRIYIMHGPPDDVTFVFGGDPLSVEITNPTEVIVGAGTRDRRRVHRLQFARPESEIWIYRHLPGARSHAGVFEVVFSRADPTELIQLHQTLRGLSSGVNPPYPTRVARDIAILQFLSTQQVAGPYRLLYAGEYKFPDIDSFYRAIFHPNRTPSFSVTDLQTALRDLERSPGDVLEEKLDRARRLREQVETRISFERFQMDLRFGSVRAASGGTLLPVTLGIDPTLGDDELDVMLELVRPDGSPAASLVDSFRLEQSAGGAAEPLLYQGRLAARPGNYTLRVYGRLKNRQSVYFGEHPVTLPDYGERDVSMSDVLLFDHVMPRRDVKKSKGSRFLGGSSPVMLKDVALVPAADTRFRRREQLTALVEVYNPGLAPGDGEPALQLQCRLWLRGRVVASLPATLLDYVTDPGRGEREVRRTAYGLTLALRTLRPGDYSLELEVHDAVSDKTVSRRTDFRVY